MNNWSGKVFIKTKDEEDARYEDVFTTYGICLLKGSYEKLLEYPTPKSLITWSDRRNNGVEYLADGDTIRVDKKSVVINVVLLAKDERDYYTKYEAFFKRLTSGIICMKIPTLGKVFKLVYSKQSNLVKLNKKSSTFALNLIEPNPTDRS